MHDLNQNQSKMMNNQKEMNQGMMNNQMDQNMRIK